MRKLLLIALILLGLTAATAANAYDLTSTCPYDGETAYFAGSKITANGTFCNYKHTGRDFSVHQQVNHSFWIQCEAN